MLVCDAGNQRNIRSQGLHGFLTRDGIQPSEFLRLAREQMKPYDVEFREVTVMDLCKEEAAFRLTLLDSQFLFARKVLLATGVVDRLPNIDGIQELYGKSVHHCPYCDGWEHRDQPIAVYGNGSGGMSLALAMKVWSKDVILCSNGAAKLRSRERQRLSRQAIPVYEQIVKRLEGSLGELRRIVFEDGSTLARSALFFSTGNVQRSKMPISLGCPVTPKGSVKTTRGQGTNLAGLYVAGDACHDAQFVAVAAAEGAKAAMAINAALQKEDQA